MSLKSLCMAGIVATASSFLIAGGASVDVQKGASASKPTAKAATKSATAPNAAKLEAIKKMLIANGMVDGNLEAAHESIKTMMKNSPNINPQFWGELDKKVNRTEFEQMLVGVYDRAYTLDEIKGITKFYESTAGKAFLVKNGKALLESGRTLQAYMESNSRELMKKYGQPASKVAPK